MTVVDWAQAKLDAEFKAVCHEEFIPRIREELRGQVPATDPDGMIHIRYLQGGWKENGAEITWVAFSCGPVVTSVGIRQFGGRHSGCRYAYQFDPPFWPGDKNAPQVDADGWRIVERPKR